MAEGLRGRQRIVVNGVRIVCQVVGHFVANSLLIVVNSIADQLLSCLQILSQFVLICCGLFLLLLF